MKVNVDENSEIKFDLRQDSWTGLIKALSGSRLPVTREYNLENVPESSSDVRAFLSNLSAGQQDLIFNERCCIKLESKDYIDSLKIAASRTVNKVLINHCNFTVEDFCELVAAGSQVKKLYIQNCKIPTDSEFEFGKQLSTCSIQQMSLSFSGHSNHSNWDANPHRFENILRAISLCEPLKNSLKILDIELCGVSRSKAEELRKKYELNGLKIKGF